MECQGQSMDEIFGRTVNVVASPWLGICADKARIIFLIKK